ncbi:MAG: hypothetical protein F4Y00_09120 [Bacteroidetes bacterium SB0662_bin_6]|nr:hypothetical protein [Bacteroidetes bacterium SB0668_bin_1]MYE05114.1 hypothetical protein [Bacteroidetes bacterium SB0662_bin_6]
MPAQKSSKSKPDDKTPPVDPLNGEPADSSDEPMTPEEKAQLEDVEHMVTEAYEQFLRTASRVSDYANETYGSVRTYAKKHPGTALLVSFLAGVVLGALTSRR